jgi:hypothetical protein
MIWEQLREHPNYDISTTYPFQIRKRSNNRIISITFDRINGYNKVRLGPHNYRYHRIIAQQFILNPDNLPQIDHINRIKTDNHLENLRWVSNIDNSKNKTSHIRVDYEFMEELPEDAIVVENYGKYQFENLYYSHSLRRFIFNNGVNFRLLYNNLRQNTETYYVNVIDTDNQQTKIYLNKFQREHDLI